MVRGTYLKTYSYHRYMKKFWFFVFAVVIVLALAWYLLSPLWRVVEVDDVSPLQKQETGEELPPMHNEQSDEDPSLEAMILAEASFLPSEHEVEGKVMLIEANGKRILRFEDFNTVNGPDLHIYLSRDLDNEDYIDLGAIKATKGNVNYELSDDVDLHTYNNVLVWCKPFGVLFSFASLTII